MFVKVPVELGLAFMIKTRVEWKENEKKAEVILNEVEELCFKTRPKDILEHLNEKKCKLLDFIQFDLERKVEDKDVFIEGHEKILGKVKEKLGTLASVPSGWQLPSSLKSFSVAILVGDLVQKDSRKNKNEYHLCQVATADDHAVLQWVCTQDLQVIDQRNKDIELVGLSHLRRKTERLLILKRQRKARQMRGGKL